MIVVLVEGFRFYLFRVALVSIISKPTHVDVGLYILRECQEILEEFLVNVSVVLGGRENVPLDLAGFWEWEGFPASPVNRPSDNRGFRLIGHGPFRSIFFDVGVFRDSSEFEVPVYGPAVNSELSGGCAPISVVLEEEFEGFVGI